PQGRTTIHLRYSATLRTDLRGLYLSKAGSRRYAVTQFESTDARRAFPSFDEPALKATYDVSVTVDKDDMAISNGQLLSDTKAGGGSGSRHTLRFATTPRMSSYLVALAVGAFQCVGGVQDQIPIRVCATPDKKSLVTLALDYSRQILAFYNHYF